MSKSIHPSRALVVGAETPIRDCIEKMRKQNTGSVLVIRDSRPHDLLGIFTERDLLKKFDQIAFQGSWDKPVALAMTHPVITLSIFELHRAADVMMEHGFRHLVLTYEDEEGAPQIGGVLSMRDVLRHTLEAKGEAPWFLEPSAERTSVGEIGLLMMNASARPGMAKLLAQNGRMEVITYTIAEVLKPSQQRHPIAFVIDLDGIVPETWVTCLKNLMAPEEHPEIVILFTPELHAPKNVETLERLTKAGKIAAFAKPINVLEVLTQIQGAL